MNDTITTLIHAAYHAFNARDADAVLSLMTTDVAWPNGWEGGNVQGKDEVRHYWTRQWKEINPVVTPTAINTLPDGRADVTVHQVVKDMQGNLLFDGVVHHVYSFEDGLICKMEIATQDA